MQRHRFFAQPAQFTLSTVTLDADESHHLLRVLRLGKGARVFVFDGNGTEWECEVALGSKNSVVLDLIRKLDDVVESPLQLTLAQSLIKGDKFDWVVQKASELGVTRIVPLITDHGDQRAERRLPRWRRIALEAAKQCGRRKLIEISEPISFGDFCESNAGKTNLIFCERGGCHLSELNQELQADSEISLSIASEGGWSEIELKTAEGNKFIFVNLGPRILRTETAAIAAVSLAQYLFGDIK